MDYRVVFMSFKPLYARKIVDGIMDCEVRTYFKQLCPRDIVLVYASHPVKAVLGYFLIDTVYTGSYNDIVAFVKNKCRLFDRDNWDYIVKHYSCSKRKLVAIKICCITVFGKPVSLNTIRSMLPIFKPPRSYMYVSSGFLETIYDKGFLWM